MANKLLYFLLSLSKGDPIAFHDQSSRPQRQLHSLLR